MRAAAPREVAIGDAPERPLVEVVELGLASLVRGGRARALVELVAGEEEEVRILVQQVAYDAGALSAITRSKSVSTTCGGRAELSGS